MNTFIKTIFKNPVQGCLELGAGIEIEYNYDTIFKI